MTEQNDSLAKLALAEAIIKAAREMTNPRGGAHDMGDLYGIYAHGLAGIAECKSYKRYGRADVEEWRRQTLAERDNADADFAVLVIHNPGCGGDAKSPTMGRNRVDLTIGDLCNVSVGMLCLMAEPDDHWVTIDLDELARLIRAD